MTERREETTTRGWRITPALAISPVRARRSRQDSSKMGYSRRRTSICEDSSCRQYMKNNKRKRKQKSLLTSRANKMECKRVKIYFPEKRSAKSQRKPSLNKLPIIPIRIVMALPQMTKVLTRKKIHIKYMIGVRQMPRL